MALADSRLILGIETSCDETSAAVVNEHFRVQSNVIATSQVSFRATGGVIPEQAARRQVECMLPVIHKALMDAECVRDEIDAIAITYGPGLLVSLLVGATAARMLSSLWRKPLVGVHHTLGHLTSTWLDTDDEPCFPVLTLSASGGHTDLWYRTSHTKGILVGRTLDDAAGEAFDKGASLLSLPYPGGPAIAKLGENGNAQAFHFSKPLAGEHGCDFSFSGLKTALKYTLRDEPDAKREDLAASYERAICVHLVDRIERALLTYSDVKEIHLVGGVSANRTLRTMTKEICQNRRLRVPQKIEYCTDNAAMIAAAAHALIRERGKDAYQSFTTVASMPLEATMKNSGGMS